MARAQSTRGHRNRPPGQTLRLQLFWGDVVDEQKTGKSPVARNALVAGDAAKDDSGLSEAEQEKIDDQAPLRSPALFASISQAGDEEMRRPSGSLFWSGLAAGVAIFASVIAEGALHEKLPEMVGREAIADLGYSVGFLIVILGRMQLFTEQTVVPVLSVARRPTRSNLARLGRLWAIVFGANMIGAFAVAGVAAAGGLAAPPLQQAMVEISMSLLGKSPGDVLLQGIPAGFLIASIAWLLASTKSDHFALVLVITYVIALGGFSHVVAGAAEAFLLAWSGEATFVWAVRDFILPALAGNIIGGTGLFALFAYAQVRREL
ncbi:formate/nitrite transporter family protein [Sphingomonas sp. SFZ2018-12]|nr:formate/nitrite transporter family protein [Sphingomonas sp. SFZ2018-12]MCH4892685.1 formate/nitrite transporter family protein [Sphingomonas sp. SFZ2018-12]